MTSKNNRAPCLGYINLCAVFQSHRGIQLELQSYKQHTQLGNLDNLNTGNLRPPSKIILTRLQTMGTQYRKNISHQRKWLLWSELPDEVITLMKITLKSKAGLVLINYSHDISDQEVQNNGGCPESAGPDKQRFLQPRKYQNYPRRYWFGNLSWALIVKIQGCCYLSTGSIYRNYTL